MKKKILPILFLFLVGCGTGSSESSEKVTETTVPETTTSMIQTEIETTTTTTTTTTTRATTTSQTTTLFEFPVTETTTTTALIPYQRPLTCLGSFRGTYYSGRTVPCLGGSGRRLNDCGVNLNCEYKGSIASKFIYETYGYYRNDEPTQVYLEIQEFSEMNGWYTVDDCNGDRTIVDFYYSTYDACPFQYTGVVSVTMYVPD